MCWIKTRIENEFSVDLVSNMVMNGDNKEKRFRPEIWIEIFSAYLNDKGEFKKDTPMETLIAYQKYKNWFEKLTASDKDYYVVE